MKNIVVEIKKLTTSNKVSDEFKGEVATKTAYLTVDDKNAKLLEEFGLRKYTSKAKDGEAEQDFFILKLTQEVKVYKNGQKGQKPSILEGTVQTPNFEIKEKPFNVNVIQGEKTNNVFYRLQALLLDDMKLIEELEAENPFA